MEHDDAWETLRGSLDDRRTVTLGGYLGQGEAPVCGAMPDDETEEICGKLATHHIVWDDEGELATSFGCAWHTADALANLKTFGAHAPGEHCAQDGTIYIHDLDICIPADGLMPELTAKEELAVPV